MISPVSSGLLPFPVLLTPKGIALSFSFSCLSWLLPPGLLPPEHAVCGIPSSYMRSLGVYGPMYLVTALLVHR